MSQMSKKLDRGLRKNLPGRTAGSRSEFETKWREWAREINRLAYQSDDTPTIMAAIQIRNDALHLIDSIADEIYDIFEGTSDASSTD
jgi:hypothetical protein